MSTPEDKKVGNSKLDLDDTQYSITDVYAKAFQEQFEIIISYKRLLQDLTEKEAQFKKTLENLILLLDDDYLLEYFSSDGKATIENYKKNLENISLADFEELKRIVFLAFSISEKDQPTLSVEHSPSTAGDEESVGESKNNARTYASVTALMRFKYRKGKLFISRALKLKRPPNVTGNLGASAGQHLVAFSCILRAIERSIRGKTVSDAITLLLNFYSDGQDEKIFNDYKKINKIKDPFKKMTKEQDFLRLNLIPTMVMEWNKKEGAAFHGKKINKELGKEGAVVKKLNLDIEKTLNGGDLNNEKLLKIIDSFIEAVDYKPVKNNSFKNQKGVRTNKKEDLKKAINNIVDDFFWLLYGQPVETDDQRLIEILVSAFLEKKTWNHYYFEDPVGMKIFGNKNASRKDFLSEMVTEAIKHVPELGLPAVSSNWGNTEDSDEQILQEEEQIEDFFELIGEEDSHFYDFFMRYVAYASVSDGSIEVLEKTDEEKSNYDSVQNMIHALLIALGVEMSLREDELSLGDEFNADTSINAENPYEKMTTQLLAQVKENNLETIIEMLEKRLGCSVEIHVYREVSGDKVLHATGGKSSPTDEPGIVLSINQYVDPKSRDKQYDVRLSDRVKEILIKKTGVQPENENIETSRSKKLRY